MTTTFEIRVEGVLSGRTLHGLGCAHVQTGEQTVLRLDEASTSLRELVDVCSRHNLTMESIVRIEPR